MKKIPDSKGELSDSPCRDKQFFKKMESRKSSKQITLRVNFQMRSFPYRKRWMGTLWENYQESGYIHEYPIQKWLWCEKMSRRLWSRKCLI